MLCIADGYEGSPNAVDMASSFDSASMAELARKHWGSILPLTGPVFYGRKWYGVVLFERCHWDSLWKIDSYKISGASSMVYGIQSNHTKLYARIIVF